MRRRDFIGGILTSALVPAMTNRGQTPVHRIGCIGYCGVRAGFGILHDNGA